MNEKLNKIFVEVFEINPIPQNFSKYENDCWDSIRHLNLIVEIETAFDVSLSPEEIYKIDSFSSAIECIKDKIYNDEV